MDEEREVWGGGGNIYIYISGVEGEYHTRELSLRTTTGRQGG